MVIMAMVSIKFCVERSLSGSNLGRQLSLIRLNQIDLIHVMSLACHSPTNLSTLFCVVRYASSIIIMIKML